MPPATAPAPRTCPRCGRSFDEMAVFCPVDGSRLVDDDVLPSPESDPYVGTVIGGDIEIREVVGVGAMGRVYRGHQRGIERDVAIKVLHRELSGNAQLVSRFHREAKIASRLQHPHVVEVFLAGQLKDGAMYIVMEFLEGLSLAGAIGKAGGSLPSDRALRIAIQICDAVGEGHARGIVHRDLKPENVMLVRRAEVDDWVKVLDFGIAKMNLGEQSMQTAAGAIFGTARYISPEGAQGAEVGPPGDVYAIATMLYQMLAGRTPFEAEQPLGLLVKHLHEAPPHLLSWPAARAVPEPIARAVMANLAKDAKDRAPNGKAFGAALAAAAREARISISDVSAIARMSQVAGKRRVDTTVDDLQATPGPAPYVPNLPSHTVPLARAPSSSMPASSLPAPVSSVPVLPASVKPPSLQPASLQPISQPPNSPPTSRSAEPHVEPRVEPAAELPRERRTRSWPLLLLAFALGITVTLLVSRELAHQKSRAYDDHVLQTRRALNDGRYTVPPKENVLELTNEGLTRWPNDAVLLQLRSDAANELVTRALTMREGGDVELARDLAKNAVRLDPADRSAIALVNQYEDEIGVDGGGAIKGPRVYLEAPTAPVKTGARVDVVAKILLDGRAPKAPFTNPRFTLLNPTLPGGESLLPATPDGPGTFKVGLVAPRPGSYDIDFETIAEGTAFRAERTIEVMP